MTYLSVSRAARLAGVTRAEIQRRIRRGELATFEGSVAASDLLHLYPSVSLSDDNALERVQRIMSDAQPRITQEDAALPSAQVLISRLRIMSKDLAQQITTANASDTLLAQTSERLEALCALGPEQLPRAIRETTDWLAVARREIAATPRPDERAQLFAKETYLRIMAAHVKLIPSGHDYFVEGNESILDASVRAGLNLNYGCTSGNCGNCKARLLSGETRKMRNHDYVISERERQMGYLLTCSHTAVTDLVIEAAEALSVDELPHQDIRASLRKIERISPDLVSLHIQTPRTQTLRFMAGQRVRLTLEDGASSEQSIASCPCDGRNLWFFIRRATDDFSRILFDTGIRHGHPITVTGPYGRFVLSEDVSDPAVLIAFGDGIAPIKSLIEHAVSIDTIESCSLYWDTTHPEGHHQGRWTRALKDALDNFTYTPLISGSVEDVITVVRADHPELGERRFYLAGPPETVARARERLIALGVDTTRILSENTTS